MSSGLRDPAADAREAAAIAALLPRAGWKLPRLEKKICVMLEKKGSPGQAFLDGHISPAIQEFFALTTFDGVPRAPLKAALLRLIKANEARRAAKEDLFRLGLGAAFGVERRSRKIYIPTDGEETIAQSLLAALGGSGQDRTRPVRHFITCLARAWNENGG